MKNPALIAPSFQKSGTVDSCRTVPVGSIHLLGDYTLVTNQVKADSHRMATRYLLHNIITKNCRAKWRILHLQNGENCRGYSDHQAMKNPLQT